MSDVVNLKEKFTKFDQAWIPRIIGEFDNSFIKIFKATKDDNGEVEWHLHDEGDEFFLILKGELTMQLRDGDVTLHEGECIVIPKGVEHRPVTESEVQLLLIESKDLVNAGTRSPQELERI